MLDQIKRTPARFAALLGSLLTVALTTGCTGFSPGTVNTNGAADRAGAAATSALDRWIDWVTNGNGGIVMAGFFVFAFLVWLFGKLKGNRAVQLLAFGVLVGYVVYAYAQTH